MFRKSLKWPRLNFTGLHRVHETINALFGDKVHVFDDEVLRQKGIAIVQKLRDAVDEWKAETGYGFSLLQHAK